MGLVRQDFV